ncbi:MAG: DNA-damage-inducible protein F, partial [uncultured Rubrobacteraceae bacterium]
VALAGARRDAARPDCATRGPCRRPDGWVGRDGWDGLLLPAHLGARGAVRHGRARGARFLARGRQPQDAASDTRRCQRGQRRPRGLVRLWLRGGPRGFGLGNRYRPGRHGCGLRPLAVACPGRLAPPELDDDAAPAARGRGHRGAHGGALALFCARERGRRPDRGSPAGGSPGRLRPLRLFRPRPRRDSHIRPDPGRTVPRCGGLTGAYAAAGRM